jgi:superfamily II DNA or RNA helicase
MFCGTGKSKIMSEGRFLAGAKLVVYVFPSLALIDQFTRQYLGDVDAAHLLCVSSEAGATTTPETIQRFFTCNEFTRADGTGNTRRIVCVTYQSMHTLFENMGETVVDVCCYDEAHHVVAPSYQSHVFSNAAIRKQVFFTATPVNDNGVVMYDPDFSRDSDFPGSSEKLSCGPLVYEYTYLRGVDEGNLNPFNVSVDFFMASAIDNESFFTTETTASTASSTLSGKMYESIARAVITSGNTRVLTFHADVNADRDLSVSNFVIEELMKRAFDHVYRTEFPEILVADRMDGNLRMVALSASTSPRDRAAILAEFDATPDNCVYIVSSCRTIGEGIDTKNANMCVFVDPKSSPLSIIQNIGRIVRKLPDVIKPRSTILIPCAVDREKYTACDTDEKRDVAIRSDLSLPTGNFNGILNVLCALRQEDDELYNACLRSGGGVAGGAGDDDGDSDSNEGGGTKSSEESDRGRSRESSSCTFSVHTDPDVKVLWRLSDMDLSKTVASAVIDCEVVKYDPMDRAREIVTRANERVANGGRLLPRRIIKPKNDAENQENKDHRILEHKAMLTKQLKGCLNAIVLYLDSELPGWRDSRREKNIENPMERARGIVDRANARVAAGGQFPPRHISKPKTNDEKYETKDATKLDNWRKALKGTRPGLCSNLVRDYLDEKIPGWRTEREGEAIIQVQAIISRANARVHSGGVLLPVGFSKPTTEKQKQEKKDNQKLSDLKMALKWKKNGSVCYDVVCRMLDENLVGWRDVRDLNEIAIQEARAIVERASERVAGGGAQLPRHIFKPKTDEEKQELKDDTKLRNWRAALNGKGHQKCSDEVRNFLDAELPGWRDVRDLNEIAIQEARAIVERASERVAGGGAQLPRHISNPRTDTEKQEKRDATKLQNWKTALHGKTDQTCSDEVRNFLDAELPGWSDFRDLNEIAIQEARAIVERASERVAGGGAPLPRQIQTAKNDADKQEIKDASKLSCWKRGLKGKGSWRCSDAVRDFLDLELPGWRDIRDFDEIAIQEARAIVGRASERVVGGGRLLPRQITKPTTKVDKQELKDETKLRNWKTALHGKNHQKCSDEVCKFLDAELPGWRDVRDFDEMAIQEARAIVGRASERVAGGGAQLPCQIRNPKNDTEKQEKKDATKLGIWRNGRRNTAAKCSDAVRDFLDLELPGWRDARGKNKEKRPLPVAQVGASDPVSHPSAMVVEPAAPVVVPTKLVTKKRKKTMLLAVSGVAASPALEEGDAKRPARSENPTPSPKSELSVLHQRYKSLTSENLAAEFAAHPAAWHAYHALSEKNEESFPTDEIPRNVVIRKLGELRTRRAKSVVDLGCGKAWIARHFLDDPRFAFTNFDHVAGNALVTKCDISLLPLEDDSTEIAILCLAMWGSNCASYVGEAYRVLETHGLLYVVEPTRRWLDESGDGGGGASTHRLRALLETCGFKIMEERIEKFSVFVCCKA